MKAVLKLILTALGVSAGAQAGTAYAQAAPPPPPPPPSAGMMGENSTVRNGGDTMDRDMAMARDAAIARSRAEGGKGKGKTRTVPATPEEIIPGAEVHDRKGVKIGVIESVSMAAAVLRADGGAVEVPLEAFGKDSKGLMINPTKDEFDKMVAEANKPAN